jgi:hypothetical protein
MALQQAIEGIEARLRKLISELVADKYILFPVNAVGR